uniref:Fibronectin type-III domain-containing protein n=1 Tax=Tetranychus urticae TaxID=32264 RepID=T1KJ29_TETUR
MTVNPTVCQSNQAQKPSANELDQFGFKPTSNNLPVPNPIPAPGSDPEPNPQPLPGSEPAPNPIPAPASDREPNPQPLPDSEPAPNPIPAPASDREPNPQPLPGSEPAPIPLLLTQTVSGDVKSLLLRNLIPDASYRIRIVARSDSGTTQAEYNFLTSTNRDYGSPPSEPGWSISDQDFTLKLSMSEISVKQSRTNLYDKPNGLDAVYSLGGLLASNANGHGNVGKECLYCPSILTPNSD